MKLEEAKVIAGQQDEEQFVAEALEAVKLKFVSSLDDIECSAGYAPEFAHQHFGETEKIVGYKNLEVNVLYTAASLFLTAIPKYQEKLPATSNLQCDDIEYKIKDTLPSTQLDAYLSLEKFKCKLTEQRKNFQPYGTLITKFHTEIDGITRLFEVYKLEKKEDDPRLEESVKFLQRAQALAFWYIDAVGYTDEEDARFFNYFIFESAKSPEDAQPYFKFAGYANLYRFYHHPKQERVRIAQMLVAPPYRSMGLGHRFLQAIYSDLWTMESVYDITAETPADSFIYMRDYADCLNCSKLAQFSREHLKNINGLTAEMSEAALKKYKLNKNQARRVYEILRLFHTNMNVQSEREQYKEEVLKRLKKNKMDPEKARRRILETFGKDDQSVAIAMLAIDPEQQLHQFESQYELLIDNYKEVIRRLTKYESAFGQ